MRLLVCGGRDYDAAEVFNHLEGFGYGDIEYVTGRSKIKLDSLIHGGARGADEGAAMWGKSEDLRVIAYRTPYALAHRPPMERQMQPSETMKDVLEAACLFVAVEADRRGFSDASYEPKEQAEPLLARIQRALSRPGADGEAVAVKEALNTIRLEARQRETVPRPGEPKDAQRGTALALTARLSSIERMAKAALAAAPVTEADTPCWEWPGRLWDSGYGLIQENARSLRAHRVIYEAVKGRVPEGLVLDHLCRNRRCVNPAHLEPVTLEENILRGESPPAENARKTHCDRGHLLDEENTYIYRGWRICKKCRTEGNRQRMRDWRAKRKEMTDENN